MPDLAARPLGAQALTDLLDRKPYLLRPLAAQLMPPRLAPIDPAVRAGIRLSSLRSAADLPPLIAAVLAAVAGGKIAPAEGLRLARRAEARLRAAARGSGREAGTGPAGEAVFDQAAPHEPPPSPFPLPPPGREG